MTAPGVRDAGVVAQYLALRSGVPPRDGEGTRLVFLVSTVDYAHGRGDLYVAAGIARALVARGHGAELVGPDGWYAPRSADEVVVVMVADTDVRRIPAGPTVVGWVRNRTDDWAASPGLALYDAVAASSELSRRELARVYAGPTGVCRIGFDPDLFDDDGGQRSVAAVSTANHWGGRRAVHTALLHLAARGVPVEWHGVDRSGDPTLRGVHRGAVEFFDVPEVYRRARVTIDDLQQNSVAYGTLNSRLFEALACGSLVVTNSALGLAEAGLDGVPVYRDAGELELLVERAAAGEHDTLAKDLQQRVRAEHTYARRAEDLERLTREAVDARTTTRSRTVVHHLPDYSATNPYQRLVYAALPEHDAVAVPGTGDLDLLVSRDAGGPLTGQVLHLHWLHGIVQPARDLDEACARLDRFRAALTDVAARGARIVWTVHNALAHELTYRFLEIELSAFVARLADVVHVMTPATLAETADLYPIPPEKVVVVEHPSYDGCYPDPLDRATARERLGIQPDDVTLLHLGAVRPYKNVPLLLDAFEVAEASDARLRLEIAGRPGATLDPAVVERMTTTPRVRAHLGFVPDADVHVHLRAADMVVLPYENVLNSGSLMLATTFGVPVVVPRLGALRGLDGAGFVELFEPGSVDSLVAAIERSVVSLRTPEARRAARDHAVRRRPADVARQMAALLAQGSEGAVDG